MCVKLILWYTKFALAHAIARLPVSRFSTDGKIGVPRFYLRGIGIGYPEFQSAIIH